MPRIPSPLHDKTIPKRVSKPTVTAEAAAAVAESAVAPAARKPKAEPVAKKAAPAKKAAAPAAKPQAAPAKKTKAAAAKKTKPATASKSKDEPAATPAPAKPAKTHKPKLVRDSFTIPKDEYAVIEDLKARALGLGQHVRKSELLRAGIQALNAMNDRAFLATVGAVPTLKTGRPKRG